MRTHLTPVDDAEQPLCPFAQYVADRAGTLLYTVAESIASVRLPGHDLRTVMTRLTTDDAVDRTMGAFLCELDDTRDVRAAERTVGIGVIRDYLRTHNLV